MIIQLTKNGAKPNIIKYIRDNGTETWMYIDDFFVRHDISHFILESVLGYHTAFNGMINQGMDIRDFENKEKRAALAVTDEAYYAENLANLFLIEIVQGEFSDFNTVQQDAFVSWNNQFPEICLADDKITQIRFQLRELLHQWEKLPEGEKMELIFEV